MPGPQLKTITVQGVEFLKAEGDTPEGYVRSVFATMDVVDLHNDVMVPGSIGKQKVRMSAYNHGSWPGFFSEGAYPVGKGEIYEDEIGGKKVAIFEGQMFMDMDSPGELYKLLKNMGAMQEWSFSLENIKAERGERNGQEVTLIKKVSVHEVSPVFKGAGVRTRTLSVKSDGTVDEAEPDGYSELEARLKATQNAEAAAILRRVI